MLYSDINRFDLNDSSWHPIVSNNFLDSVEGGATFQLGNRGYFFGGYTDAWANGFYKDMWYFDATDLIRTGLNESGQYALQFKIYPTPINHQTSLCIESNEKGTIEFSNSLGQKIYSRPLDEGVNTFDTEYLGLTGFVFYRAHFPNGETHSGKIAILQ